jgi:Ca-activated chloride channel homolog
MGAMTWPGFLAVHSAWLFLLLIPLIIFYFLKLRRPKLQIPSLALWRSVLADRRVNSPFQKFKRNLLLLLQLLLLVCLVLASMQPFWPSGAERVQNLPVLIDCSASMAALDRPDGLSRLDEAKARIGQLIDEMLPDQRMSLIAVSNTARRLTEFTDDKRVLRAALAELKVSQVASRLEDGLRMTQALARTVPVETAFLYTDGNIPAIVDFELPFQLNFQRLPSGGNNLGITALSAQHRDDQWEVFVRVEGARPGAQQPDGAAANRAATTADDSAPPAAPPPDWNGAAAVQLFKDNRKIAEEAIVLDPGQSQRLEFLVDASGPSAVEVRLMPDGFDALDADNIAYLDLPVARPLTIYCSSELGSYRQALQGIKDVVVYPADEGGDAPASFDLVITDRKEDAELESDTFLFVGVIPDDVGKLLKFGEGTVQIRLASQRAAVAARPARRRPDRRYPDLRGGGQRQGL